MKNEKLLKLVMTGVFAALSYVVFTFLQIKITLPGGDATSIHLGNAVCVLGALLLGGLYGGAGGAIGMTIGDLLDPYYILYAPKTFILKLCIGLITGLIAHRLGHISTEKDNAKVLKWTIAAAVGGLLFNVIFPLWHNLTTDDLNNLKPIFYIEFFQSSRYAEYPSGSISCKISGRNRYSGYWQNPLRAYVPVGIASPCRIIHTRISSPLLFVSIKAQFCGRTDSRLTVRTFHGSGSPFSQEVIVTARFPSIYEVTFS